MNKKTILILIGLAVAGYVIYKKKSDESPKEVKPNADPNAIKVTESASSSEAPQVAVVTTETAAIKAPSDVPGGPVVVSAGAKPFFTVG